MDAFLKVRMTLDFYQFGVQQSDLLSVHEYFQKYEPQIPNLKMDSQERMSFSFVFTGLMKLENQLSY